MGGENWIQRLTAIGWKAESLVHSAVGFQPVFGGEKRIRFRAGSCWVFPSVEAATECNQNGNSCLGGYPYAEAGSDPTLLLSKAWDDVAHATTVGLTDALHMAQVVHFGGSDAPFSECAAEESGGCCGVSFSGNVVPGWWGASANQYNYSAGAATCNVAGAGVVGAHEFGHQFGLDHNNLQSFMHTPAFDGSLLPAADQATLVGCMETFDCPRPSGFRVSGP